MHRLIALPFLVMAVACSSSESNGKPSVPVTTTSSITTSSTAAPAFSAYAQAAAAVWQPFYRALVDTRNYCFGKDASANPDLPACVERETAAQTAAQTAIDALSALQPPANAASTNAALLGSLRAFVAGVAPRIAAAKRGNVDEFKATRTPVADAISSMCPPLEKINQLLGEADHLDTRQCVAVDVG